MGALPPAEQRRRTVTTHRSPVQDEAAQLSRHMNKAACAAVGPHPHAPVRLSLSLVAGTISGHERVGWLPGRCTKGTYWATHDGCE